MKKKWSTLEKLKKKKIDFQFCENFDDLKFRKVVKS